MIRASSWQAPPGCRRGTWRACGRFPAGPQDRIHAMKGGERITAAGGDGGPYLPGRVATRSYSTRKRLALWDTAGIRRGSGSTPPRLSQNRPRAWPKEADHPRWGPNDLPHDFGPVPRDRVNFSSSSPVSPNGLVVRRLLATLPPRRDVNDGCRRGSRSTENVRGESARYSPRATRLILAGTRRYWRKRAERGA